MTSARDAAVDAPVSAELDPAEDGPVVAAAGAAIDADADAGHDTASRAGKDDASEAVVDALVAVRGELGPRTVVALSGGLDSCVLLHALRYSVPTPGSLMAAHFDHRMRPGSEADARWVRGLCRAWQVQLVEGAVDVAGEVPESEDQARSLRYAFLRRVAAERGADLLTAHHADDQAETVLFRVLRGTGIEGLAGIPHRRILTAEDGSQVALLRPLLGVTREDVEAYAARRGVPSRLDPTNEASTYARNVIRNDILPRAETAVASGARRALVRLAEIAGDEEAAWTSAMTLILPAIDARGAATAATDVHGKGESSVDRAAFHSLGPPLAARVLRRLAAGAGVSLDRDATRRALDFIRDSQSGRRVELGRGVELHLKGDRVVVVPFTPNPNVDGRARSAPVPEETAE